MGIAGAASFAAGCGMLLYPERRGQPAGKLDWAIVALDAIGLLFFFVPGVIAFAVDFATGTIYLPADECVHAPNRDRHAADRGLVACQLPADERTADAIERAIAQCTGRTVQLEQGRYETRELESIEQFWTARAVAAARRV